MGGIVRITLDDVVYSSWWIHRRHWFSVTVPINFCDKFLCLFHILFL